MDLRQLKGMRENIHNVVKMEKINQTENKAMQERLVTYRATKRHLEVSQIFQNTEQMQKIANK